MSAGISVFLVYTKVLANFDGSSVTVVSILYNPFQLPHFGMKHCRKAYSFVFILLASVG